MAQVTTRTIALDPNSASCISYATLIVICYHHCGPSLSIIPSFLGRRATELKYVWDFGHNVEFFLSRILVPFKQISMTMSLRMDFRRGFPHAFENRDKSPPRVHSLLLSVSLIEFSKTLLDRHISFLCSLYS